LPSSAIKFSLVPADLAVFCPVTPRLANMPGEVLQAASWRRMADSQLGARSPK
jgi:hypothetical protein